MSCDRTTIAHYLWPEIVILDNSLVWCCECYRKVLQHASEMSILGLGIIVYVAEIRYD